MTSDEFDALVAALNDDDPNIDAEPEPEEYDPFEDIVLPLDHYDDWGLDPE